MVDPDGSLSKKQKLVGETNPLSLGMEVEDGMSSLPDSVLCYILSFLPTKEAVRTSVLSKRWKYQWTSLPRITLDDSLLDPSKKGDHYQIQLRKFVNFVDGVIFHHDSSNIEQFSLSLNVPIKQSRINAWISAVISKKVQVLELTLCHTPNYVFPFSLFAFKTLTGLHLENCSLNISTAITFGSLKTCRLVGVNFLEDSSTQCCFPDSPVLENLVLDYCIWPKWATFIVALPSLKSFKLGFYNLYAFVKIYAPNLQDLELRGGFVFPDWVLCHLHSLVNVSLEYLVEGSTDIEKAERIIRVFRGIQAVKSLKIHGTLLGKVSLIEHLKLGSSIPTFHRLTHLEVLVDDCFTDGVDIMRILLRSPKLESLYIDASRQSDWFWVNDEWLKYTVPDTFKPVLKEVWMDGFHGNVAEMHLLQILLAHSVSLERLHIYCDKILIDNPNKKEQVTNMVHMFPKASSSCFIELSAD